MPGLLRAFLRSETVKNLSLSKWEKLLIFKFEGTSLRLQNLLHKKTTWFPRKMLLKNGPTMSDIPFEKCLFSWVSFAQHVVHQAESEGFPKLDPSFTYLHRRELSSNVISSARVVVTQRGWWCSSYRCEGDSCQSRSSSYRKTWRQVNSVVWCWSEVTNISKCDVQKYQVVRYLVESGWSLLIIDSDESIAYCNYL